MLIVLTDGGYLYILIIVLTDGGFLYVGLCQHGVCITDRNRTGSEVVHASGMLRFVSMIANNLNRCVS